MVPLPLTREVILLNNNLSQSAAMMKRAVRAARMETSLLFIIL